MDRSSTGEKLDFEKVWLMFQETDRKFKETDRKFQETDEKFKETAVRFQETDRKFEETTKKFQETDRLLRNLAKKMAESETRWGKFVESLVEGTLIKLLNQRGIEVETTSMRVKSRHKRKTYEYDIIAKNGDTVVVVEVKTTLGIEDVKRFIEKMGVFREIFKEYDNHKIIGGVAYINSESEADSYAAKNGLYVIKATNESARIVNRKDFQPRYW